MLNLLDELNVMVRSGLIYTSLVFSEHISLYVERTKRVKLVV